MGEGGMHGWWVVGWVGGHAVAVPERSVTKSEFRGGAKIKSMSRALPAPSAFFVRAPVSCEALP